MPRRRGVRSSRPPDDDGLALRLRLSLEVSHEDGLPFEEAWQRAVKPEGRLPWLWRSSSSGESPIAFACRHFKAAYEDAG